MIEIEGRRILTTLDEKVAPAHAAVVVIDCQDEFIAEGGFWDQLGQDVSETKVVAARIAEFLEQPAGTASGSSMCAPSTTATT